MAKVPNTGYVDKVYFNTKLSVDEVKALVESIGNDYYILNNATDTKTILINYENGECSIGIIDNGTTTYLFTSYAVDGVPFIGWNPNYNFASGITIGGEVSSKFASIVSVGEQNDKLVNLVSTTPFITASGAVVPNTGYVEKYYVNTLLSIEEVVEILDNLVIDSQGEPYFALTTSSNSIEGAQLVILRDANNDYVIGSYYNVPNGGDSKILFTTIDLNYGFVGWNPAYQTEFLKGITINSNVYDNIGDLAPSVGTQNDKITKLFSLTPFVTDYLPNNGFVEKVYFNAKLTTTEVDEIIRNANLTFINMGDDVMAYALLCSEETQTLFGIRDLGAGYIIMNFDGTLYYDSQNGWNSEVITEEGLTINSNVVNAYYGMPVGVENIKLANLVKTTPFTNGAITNLPEFLTSIANAIREKKGTSARINAQNFASEIASIESGSSEDRLKKLLDTTKSCYYLFKDYTGESVDDLISYNDTENVTNMSSMFFNCSKLTSVPLLDTSKVNDMNSMFGNCSNLTSIPPLNTNNMFNITSMFIRCKNLPKVDISYYKISISNYSGYIFQDCYRLKAVIIRSFGTKYVLNSNAFYNCYHMLGTTDATYNPDGLHDGYVYVPRDMIATLQADSVWGTLQFRVLEDYTKDGTTTGEFDDEKAFASGTTYAIEDSTLVVSNVSVEGTTLVVDGINVEGTTLVI